MSLSIAERFILKTLAYADVFDWPVREDEVFAQIKSSKCKVQNYNVKLKNSLKKLIISKRIAHKNNFYFLYGKDKLVERRLQREKWASEKMMIARKTADRLKIIPSILLVGVSGGLAVGNVVENDDIDFFIVCRQGTLWTTRFLSIILLELLGQRRRPNDKYFKNKICLNMFVDEVGMVVPESERDIYTIHEIGQLKLVWERNETYEKFLKANQWVLSCHSDPAQPEKNLGQPLADRNYASLDPSVRPMSDLRMTRLERIFRWLQLKYMGKKRTSEKIEPHRLLFHPQDKRREILGKYQQRLKELEKMY